MLPIASAVPIVIALLLFIAVMCALSLFVQRCSLRQPNRYTRVDSAKHPSIATPLGYWSSYYGRRVAVLPEKVHKRVEHE